MYFRIERDHLAEQGSDYSDKGKGFVQPGSPPKAERKYPVALYCYDDDMNLYYTIGCSCSEAAEYAHDWARDNAGCTFSKIAEPRTEPAEPFIG